MPDEHDPRMPDEVPEERPEDDDVPFHLPFSDDIEATQHDAPVEDKPLWNADNPMDARNMPTMPIPREPGVPDPKKTLQGSGGLDPNPDFNTRPNDVGNTMRHQAVRLDNTMPHEVAPAQRDYNQQYQQPYPQPPANIPPAPRTNPAPQQPLQRRQNVRKRGCLGCSRGCIGLIAGFIAIFCGGLTLLTIAIGGAYASRVQQQLTA